MYKRLKRDEKRKMKMNLQLVSSRVANILSQLPSVRRPFLIKWRCKNRCEVCAVHLERL